MSEAFFLQRADTLARIDELARASQLTLFVGAGVPMEVGLPSWSELVRRLLRRIAKDTQAIRRLHSELEADGVNAGEREQRYEEAVDAFVDGCLENNSLLGAAAIVKRYLNGPDYGEAVRTALFAGREPRLLNPGPIALEIARYWKQCENSNDCLVLTTNYDRLLERALTEVGVPATDIRSRLPIDEPGKKPFEIVHLHGVIEDDSFGPPVGLVLAEDEYLTDGPESKARRSLVLEALQRPSLFVGTSLSDPNVLSYLYAAEQSGQDRTARPQHLALTLTQADATASSHDLERHVLAALRETTAERLAAINVAVLNADYFSEVSEFLAEVSRHRGMTGKQALPYGAASWRWGERIDHWEQQAFAHGLLPTAAMPRSLFAARQQYVRELLNATICGVARVLNSHPETRVEGEELALHLWAASPTLRQLILIGQSDRVSFNPSTLHRAVWELPTTYLVVESLCQGVVVEASDGALNSSRWGSMLAAPIVLPHGTTLPDGYDCGRLSVGVAVMASSHGQGNGLARLRNRAALRASCLAAIVECLLPILRLQLGTAPVLTLPEVRQALDAEQELEPPRPRQTNEPRSPRVGEGTVITGALPERISLSEWEHVVRSVSARFPEVHTE